MGKSIRVLIVEDSEDDAGLLIRLLKGGGYDPSYEIVETPELMSDALDRQEWDLVISDYLMPLFSGLDALKLLQERDPDLSFILMSGQVGEDVAVEAMKAGAHDYILKNNLARLIPAVERELRDTCARRKNRQNEQVLRELRDKYIMLSTYNRDIILYARSYDGRIIEANEAAVKEYGYSRAELLGMTIHDLHTEDERQYLDERTSWADKSGITFETYQLRKDRTTFPVEVSSQGMFIKAERIFLNVIRNTTLRRQQEEKILIANEVFEHTLTGFIVISRDGVAQRINPAFTAITGYGEDDVIGQKVGILGHGAAMASVEPLSGETWNKRKDGTSYLEGFVFNAIRDQEGGIVQYIKSFRDITEVEETKRQRQLLLEQQEMMHRLSSISVLSAGIVHEIAQPLNAIKLLADGMLYLHNRGLFKLEEFIESLEDIAGQAERINTLINQMRSFANADRQKETTPCSLNGAVRSIINILGQRLSNHGIITEIELDENLPSVLGTGSGYEELVLNLLINAMSALDSVDKREKEIVIRTFSREDKAILEIADNATGICADIKDRIFEPLFTTKKIGEGMGLGLSIAQSIVERFNGSIAAQNNVNGGATFTVQVPANTK
jgi:two-component system cell cycle sensor histidine kinase/response regulator CckA